MTNKLPGRKTPQPFFYLFPMKGQKDFTIVNSMERIKSEGDLFNPVLGKGINLNRILKTYNSIISVNAKN
ncbi:MAG TPA: hypothetical protein VJ765_03725 [Chitinophagaceae bacterium]|nr:hypothetical protein [Chitinophagaceae bacterium]